MDKKIKKAWNFFLAKAEENGYTGISYNRDSSLGTGSSMRKNDKFAPIIGLHIWEYPDVSMSIHVKDRNGNDICDGPSCAIHILDDCPDFNERFEKMCTYVFEKYGKYSRENRLDFAYNELQEERIEWHKENI